MNPVSKSGDNKTPAHNTHRCDIPTFSKISHSYNTTQIKVKKHDKSPVGVWGAEGFVYEEVHPFAIPSKASLPPTQPNEEKIFVLRGGTKKHVVR